MAAAEGVTVITVVYELGTQVEMVMVLKIGAGAEETTGVTG